MRPRWTDENRAFAAAQYASGIKQRDIAAIFGYPTAAPISIAIGDFVRKYHPDHPLLWAIRPEAIKQSIAAFVKQRNEQGAMS